MEKLRALQKKSNENKRAVAEDVVDAIITQSSKDTKVTNEPSNKVEENKSQKKAKPKSKADLFKTSVPRTERHSIYLPKELEDNMQTLLDEINSDGNNKKSFNDLTVDILELFFKE